MTTTFLKSSCCGGGCSGGAVRVPVILAWTRIKKEMNALVDTVRTDERRKS